MGSCCILGFGLLDMRVVATGTQTISLRSVLLSAFVCGRHGYGCARGVEKRRPFENQQMRTPDKINQVTELFCCDRMLFVIHKVSVRCKPACLRACVPAGSIVVVLVWPVVAKLVQLGANPDTRVKAKANSQAKANANAKAKCKSM